MPPSETPTFEKMEQLVASFRELARRVAREELSVYHQSREAKMESLAEVAVARVASRWRPVSGNSNNYADGKFCPCCGKARD